MSRIGKLPVALPKDVKGTVQGSVVSVEGPKGKLSCNLSRAVSVTLADGKFVVSLVGNDAQAKTDYGTARSTINNMVTGVSKGWKKTLELNGVGFNAKVQGKNLVLEVEFTHDVVHTIPEGIKCTVNKNMVEVEGVDKELLGTFAARIRDTYPAEPYLGKGIKYQNEAVRRKAGKTGKK